MTGLAIVESPLQVLGLVDAVLAGRTGRLRVVARTPAARATFEALAQHVPVEHGLHVVGRARGSATVRPGPPQREARPAGARPHRAPSSRPLPAGATTTAVRPPGLVLGDALSGVGQARFLGAGARTHVTLLDDGTATLLVVDALLGRRPLVRAHVPATALRRALASAALTALVRRARAGRLTLRTCLPLPEHDVLALARDGVDVARHGLEHVRALDVAPAVAEEVVVLGTALADDGLVDLGAYEDWLARTVDDELAAGRTVRYLAHRREPASRLARLVRRGVRADAVALPAELRLRSTAGLRRVVTLPTSVLVTIGPTLVAEGVDVDAQAVPHAWWTPRASDALRDHLDLPRELLARATAAGPARERPRAP